MLIKWGVIFGLICTYYIQIKHHNNYLISNIAFIIMVILGLCAIAILTGCTKTIYVPAQCPTPKPIQTPVDYMQRLTLKSTPDDFVKSCLATHLDYKRAYTQCEKQLNVYATLVSPD